MIRMIAALTVLSLSLAPWAIADTVFFKDGSQLDGSVSRPDSDTLVLSIGDSKMTFPASEVAKVETNEKSGDAAKLSAIRGKQHEDDLFKRTGLTAKQRDEVRAAVDPLWSADEAERNAARKKLLEMGKQMPVFQYLESFLPYSKALVAGEIMQTLVEMDPARAKSVVGLYIQNADPANRSKALELVGAYKGADDVETVARGMKDGDNSVRIAAAHTLATMGSKRATPALIEGLNSPDLKVQNASRAALSQLWSADGAKSDLQTADQWRAFWNGKAKTVADPLDVSALEPLVAPEDLAGATASHDE